MRFRSLEVQNLRAVHRFAVEDLSDFIMIAGPNGSGKSCVFDAIRLLKSFYGGYQQDEHMQWFGEFAINVSDSFALRRLFRDPTKPMTVVGEIEFAQDEANYLRSNVRELAWPIAWQRVTGQRPDPWTFSRVAIATQLAQYQEKVDEELTAIESDVTSALATGTQLLSLQIGADGGITLRPCPPAEVAFQAYRPDHLGIIEYHSASRTYTRQDVGGITLDTRQFADQRRQQSLYNWQAKYQNVKTELAAAYVRNLISEKAEVEAPPEVEDLNETLKELFRTFFPDKTYEGVQATETGGLSFPVRLQSGHAHDIDDLSSGEKEILYGYLRLRNTTPRNSVVLLDEPELHLNPSLLQGFTDFYHEHIGRAQGNQLWLVTHSDTLLRQTVGNSNYRVYHMVSATALLGDNQSAEVLLDDDIERVAIDLVGDLASYRPHAKVVILEGESSEGVDILMVKRLFPEVAKRVNLVSGGPKRRVRDLYRVLSTAVEGVGVRNRFFAITDRDWDTGSDLGAQEFSWDAYHIENYLLDTACVRAATVSLLGRDLFDTDEDVLGALAKCAELTLDRLVVQSLQDLVHSAFGKAMSIGTAKDTKSPGKDMRPSIEASANRIHELVEEFSEEKLQALADEMRNDLRESINSGAWLKDFPGRLVLHRFADQYLGGIKYEALAYVILDKMVERSVQPAGMKDVLERIMAS